MAKGKQNGKYERNVGESKISGLSHIYFLRPISVLAEILVPFRPSKALNRRIVLGARCFRGIFQPQEIIDVFGYDRADSVNRLVSGQAFFHQASERPDYRFIVQSQLILDNRMNDRVESSSGPRQRDSGISMVPLSEHQPFAFVKSKPFLRVRRYVRVVAIHRRTYSEVS